MISHRDLGIRAKVHDEVVRKLGSAILDGTFDAGDRLPNEETLQQMFGVSRTSVREAVKFLSAKGMIESRPRLGMVVRRPEAWSLLDPEVLAWQQDGLDGDTLLIRSLLEARMAVEPMAAALAAERATASDIAAIEAGYRGMQANFKTDIDACCEADLAFHRAVIKASGNIIFRHMAAMIGTALGASFRLTAGLADCFARSVPGHGAVLEAIRERDPDGARERMQTLVQYACDDLEPTLTLLDRRSSSDDARA